MKIKERLGETTGLLSRCHGSLTPTLSPTLRPSIDPLEGSHSTTAATPDGLVAYHKVLADAMVTCQGGIIQPFH